MKKFRKIPFTPEQEVLLWAIRIDRTKDLRIVEILKAGVDWTYIRENAIQHGIIPLIYKRLKEDMGGLVPADELSTLRILFIANATRNLRMIQELQYLLTILTDAGIKAMPFKGPILAVQAYEDLSMRSFSDLDILICKKDLKKIDAILKKHGFIPTYPQDLRSKRKLLIFRKEIVFLHNGIIFEFHWKITEPLLSIPLDMNRIWKKAVQITVNGHDYWTISHEDMVLILCIHGTKHFWNNLKWLADLGYLIRHLNDQAWFEISDLAKELSIRRLVLISFLLVQKRCGLKYPSEFCNYFTFEKINFNIVYRVESNIFHPDYGSVFFIPPIFYLKSREGLRHKINYFFYFLADYVFYPTSEDFKAINLPELLFPLYFGVRQFRLVLKYGIRFICFK